MHGGTDIFSCGLRFLEIDIQAPVPCLAIQAFHKREQAGGLACLTRRVEDKVSFSADQAEQVIEIRPAERRQAIIIVGPHRPFGIEEAFHVRIANGWGYWGDSARAFDSYDTDVLFPMHLQKPWNNKAIVFIREVGSCQFQNWPMRCPVI